MDLKAKENVLSNTGGVAEPRNGVGTGAWLMLLSFPPPPRPPNWLTWPPELEKGKQRAERSSMIVWPVPLSRVLSLIMSPLWAHSGAFCQGERLETFTTKVWAHETPVPWQCSQPLEICWCLSSFCPLRYYPPFHYGRGIFGSQKHPWGKGSIHFLRKG